MSLEKLALEANTVSLSKGRLDLDDDGSTVIVRGGHEYDADTGVVSVSKQPAVRGRPDGLLVDESGEVCLPTGRSLPFVCLPSLAVCVSPLAQV